MGKSKHAASKLRRAIPARAPKAHAAPPTSAPRQFKKHEFYSWLLLAIRTTGQEAFEAEGPLFYEAFLRAVALAKSSPLYAVDGLSEMTPDPVFGVVHQANEMLLEAEEDRIISLLNPQLKEARFKISSTQASKELAESGDAKSWFEGLARAFLDAQQAVDRKEAVEQGGRTGSSGTGVSRNEERATNARKPRRRNGVEAQGRA